MEGGTKANGIGPRTQSGKITSEATYQTERASHTGRHHSSILPQEGHQVGHMIKDLEDLQTDTQFL